MNDMVKKMPTRHGETVRLVALLDGRPVGQVYQDRNGRFRFAYFDEWQQRADAYPLSLAMPLTAQAHTHEAINAFLWGLLPDNNRTLDQYGRLFGVSAANPVALLAHMGADCAGAVQFAPPDRVDSLMATANTQPEVEWLSVDQVATELRTVREHGIPGTNRQNAGQFSLAGAQPKIALLEEDGRWGRPSGRTPTNTILKPPSRDFRGFAENEHFCLELANSLNLGVVRSRVQRFHEEIAIVVDRFDRQKRGSVYCRIHQEDACQALGIMPTRKYENEGGPGVKQVVALLRDFSQKPEEDVDRFLTAIALNWVVAATDGHAKNYALLHGAGGATRLAPFYDIASYLPYADAPLHRVKLAMNIGSQYLVRRIDRASWEALAKSIRVPSTHLLERVEFAAESVATNVDGVRQSVMEEGLDRDVIDQLANRIRDRAQSCLSALRVSVQAVPAA